MRLGAAGWSAGAAQAARVTVSSRAASNLIMRLDRDNRPGRRGGWRHRLARYRKPDI